MIGGEGGVLDGRARPKGELGRLSRRLTKLFHTFNILLYSRGPISIIAFNY